MTKSFTIRERWSRHNASSCPRKVMSHSRFPDRASRQSKWASSVFHVDEVSPHCDSTDVMASGIVKQTRTHWTLVVPQDPSRLRVEGNASLAEVKYITAVDDHRSGSSRLELPGMENPCGAQLGRHSRSDFAQTAVAASGVIAIVRRPIGGDRPDEQVFRGYIYVVTVSCAPAGAPGKRARAELEDTTARNFMSAILPGTSLEFPGSKPRSSPFESSR